MSTLTLGGSTLANKTGSVVSINDGVVLPAGSVLQVNQVCDQTLTDRVGDKSSWALIPNMTCTLPNNLQSGSKLLASFSGLYGEYEGTWYACTTVFTLFQNSTNVAGNQLNSLDGDHGFVQVGTRGAGQQYWREPFSSSALFTPTGDDTAKRSVSLYWKNNCTASFTSYLNRAGNTAVEYQAGATVLTLMEIAS